jgi:cell division protease FtsH
MVGISFVRVCVIVGIVSLMQEEIQSFLNIPNYRLATKTWCFHDSNNIISTKLLCFKKNYSPYQNYYENIIKRLNKRNTTDSHHMNPAVQSNILEKNNSLFSVNKDIDNFFADEDIKTIRDILDLEQAHEEKEEDDGFFYPEHDGDYNEYSTEEDFFKNLEKQLNGMKRNSGKNNKFPPRLEIYIPLRTPSKKNEENSNNIKKSYTDDNADDDDDGIYDSHGRFVRSKRNNKVSKKSENFEVISKSSLTFNDIGGYDNIKMELSQCIDILTNYEKYKPYNVRVPKGLILEGPPGNGKTMLAKSFAGEAKISFIAVSGSQFQEKYVGVGPQRIRELFELAEKNRPCIIFIDEIDALGRKRSSDGESSSSERDSTLNELLISLDGFKTKSGIFLMGATNRIDLLDKALMRPGRIDKTIYIGNPDAKTRRAILEIHLKGKPYDKTIEINNLVEQTSGLSGSQIENLLNEAMLNALRYNRFLIESRDIDMVMNKIMVGWQPTEHEFSTELIERIAIHEMGHAIIGYLAKHYAKLSEIRINLYSPNSPGYTRFERDTTNIHTREFLFEELMVLLAGRIAEEVIYDMSVTTGAISDFERAGELAKRIINEYGMGKTVIHPGISEHSKQLVDNEVYALINDAYKISLFILKNCKELILETSDILKRDRVLNKEQLKNIIDSKYAYVNDLL